MNLLHRFLPTLSLFAGGALIALFAACQSTGTSPGTFSALPSTNLPINGAMQEDEGGTGLQVGEKVTIQFINAGPDMPPAWEQQVREDGAITLPHNLTVNALHKRRGELEKEIYDLYVPKYYRRMTVNVKPEERWYWIQGQVRNPSQLKHTGQLTVLQAIASAGDFTDFADRKDIDVIRKSGEKLNVNAKKAARNPELNIPIYPGDTIIVNRRF